LGRQRVGIVSQHHSQRVKELDSGVPIEDQFSARGRKKAEEQLPTLLIDISAIADGQSQTVVNTNFGSSALFV